MSARLHLPGTMAMSGLLDAGGARRGKTCFARLAESWSTIVSARSSVRYAHRGTRFDLLDCAAVSPPVTRFVRTRSPVVAIVFRSHAGPRLSHRWPGTSLRSRGLTLGVRHARDRTIRACAAGCGATVIRRAGTGGGRQSTPSRMRGFGGPGPPSCTTTCGMKRRNSGQKGRGRPRSRRPAYRDAHCPRPAEGKRLPWSTTYAEFPLPGMAIRTSRVT